MAEIERLIVRMEATHREYARDMMRAQKAADRQLRKIDAKVSKTARGFSKFGKTAAGAIAGIISAAAARQLVRGIEGAIDKLDEIAKTADGIGLTTDALQELRVAGNLAGVDTDVLNVSLRRLARTASDAKNGLSTSVRAFDSIGVSVTNADGSLKSIDKLLLDVADGMAGMTNATQRAATAQELFGRSGTTMVNMLKEGSDAIQVYMDKARKLGAVIDEELIRRSVEAKDELFLLKEIIGTRMTVALAELAPHLLKAAELLAKIAEEAAFAANAWREILGLPSLEFPIAGAKQQIAEISSNIAGLDSEIEGLKSRRKALGPRLGERAQDRARAGINENLADAIRRREHLADDLAAVEERLDVLLDPDDISGAAGGGGGGGDGGGGGGGRPGFNVENALDGLAAEAEALKLRIFLIGKNTRDTAEFTATERLLSQALRNGVELTAEQVDRVFDLGEKIGILAEQEEMARAKIEAANKALEDQAEAADETKRAAEEASQALGGMFTDAISQADDLEGALIQLGKRLAELAVQGLFGQGPLGGILGSIGSAVLGASRGGGAPLSSPLPPIKPFEHGGRFRAGRPMIVGERRPELIVPDFSGVVVPRVPRDGTGRRGGGGAVIINISQNIDARGAVEGTDAKIARALDENNRRLPNIIRDAQRRGK